jgi:hypothetical protein
VPSNYSKHRPTNPPPFKESLTGTTALPARVDRPRRRSRTVTKGTEGTLGSLLRGILDPIPHALVLLAIERL